MSVRTRVQAALACAPPLSLFLAGVLAAQSAAPSAVPRPDSLPIASRTLANGLEVIVVENHAVPLVTVELDVRNGAYTQTPEYAGLAHLYEHMYFKANRSIPSQERYLERSNELGLAWNGTTSDERVNYFFSVGVDSLEPAMQFMEDAIRHPLFEQAELERERPVVLGEFDRNEADPFFHLFRGTDTLLWSPGYYSRKNTIGDRQVIATATREKMRAIQQRYYVPNNTALILSGDITPARGFELAERIFGDWPRGADPFAEPVPDPPPLTGHRAVIVEQPVNTAALRVAWQGPSVDDDPKATYVADVLANILANPAGRFQKRLVESGMAFSASWSYYTLAHVGPVSFLAQTTPEKLPALRRALDEEIARLGDSSYVTAEELAAARTQIAVQGAYERERASELAHTVGFWWAVAGLDYYLGYRRNMQAVTRSDIVEFARTYLIGKPTVAGALVGAEARRTAQLTAEMLLPQGATP
jgi:zinc protease